MQDEMQDDCAQVNILIFHVFFTRFSHELSFQQGPVWRRAPEKKGDCEKMIVSYLMYVFVLL